MKSGLSFYIKVLSFLISLQGNSWVGFSQYDNVWAFGNNAGLDFNFNPPRAIKTNMQTSEGTASISDANGQLLFYTDGTDVRDRNHSLMPNGRDLAGLGNITASTSQGALIVPYPGKAGQYYVFSLGALATTANYGLLYYSIVDMNLNSGLGDVVPGSKSILLDSFLTEQMTAVSGNDCNIWLLVVSRLTPEIKSYRIDINGINSNPIRSVAIPGGGVWGGVIGCMDVSPNRNKIAIARGNLTLYDFDPGSGLLSQPYVLVKDFRPYYYSVSFSPDNSQLYSSAELELFQFDVRTFVKSKINLDNESVSAIKRAPDGKIYISAYGKSSLNVIHQPNLSGTGCQYETQAINLLGGTAAQSGLPNAATIVSRRQVSHVQEDTIFCTSSRMLTARNLAGSNYIWNDGYVGSSRSIDSSGVFWVTYEVASPCMFDECTDTFKVTRDQARRKKETYSSLAGWCAADTLMLSASNTGGTRYTWEDGTLGPQRLVNRSGIFTLRYAIDSVCTDIEDSFDVRYPEKDYRVSFITDTLVCSGEELAMNNTSAPHYQDFKWWFGDGDTAVGRDVTHTYHHAGRYELKVMGTLHAKCMDTTYTYITVDSPVVNQFVLYPERICLGEAIHFEAQLQYHTVSGLHWHLGDEMSFASGLENRVQHSYDRVGTQSIVLTTTYRACPADSFSKSVYVTPAPDVYLGLDTSICFKGAPLVLSNLREASPLKVRYWWNTGDTTATLRVTAPGVYTLRLSEEEQGCSATATINIEKDCYIDVPNVFTPNGDGANDYFFPRKGLSKGVEKFHLQIFNRWGQLLYETKQNDGLGWDGKFNGVDQPSDVYVCRLSVSYTNGTTEQYGANVTLMR